MVEADDRELVFAFAFAFALALAFTLTCDVIHALRVVVADPREEGEVLSILRVLELRAAKVPLVGQVLRLQHEQAPRRIVNKR